jgi:hypothetical protein
MVGTGGLACPRPVKNLTTAKDPSSSSSAHKPGVLGKSKTPPNSADDRAGRPYHAHSDALFPNTDVTDNQRFHFRFQFRREKWTPPFLEGIADNSRPQIAV